MNAIQLSFDWSTHSLGKITDIEGIETHSSVSACNRKASGEGFRQTETDADSCVALTPENRSVESSHEPIGADERRTLNYDPGHPWYYLPRGDNCPPIPADQIPPAEAVGRFIEREVPKNPLKRTKKLRELLAIEQHDLAIDIERYQEIAEKGIEALSKYDRDIAHGGNDELARATALALKFNHIAWGRGRVAWLETQLGKLAFYH